MNYPNKIEIDPYYECGINKAHKHKSEEEAQACIDAKLSKVSKEESDKRKREQKRLACIGVYLSEILGEDLHKIAARNGVSISSIRSWRDKGRRYFLWDNMGKTVWLDRQLEVSKEIKKIFDRYDQ